MAGVFITFEGLDGCGKTTQLRLLAEWLNEHGNDVLVTREPGGTALGQRVRALLLENDAHIDPLAELLLFAADRAQHVRTLICPALTAGRIVLSDRYADATAAYQGAGRQFDAALITQIIALATDGLQPALTLLFDLPAEEALARTQSRAATQPDRLDSEHISFHRRVRQAYLDRAAAAPNRIRVLDARADVAEIQTQVRALIKAQISALTFDF